MAKTKLKPHEDPLRAEYHLHHSNLRWVAIGSPTGMDVYDGLPVNVVAPNNPQVLAVAPSAFLVPGKRAAVRMKKGAPRKGPNANRQYDFVCRFVKETAKRFYIATPTGRRLPPLEKSECESFHPVVAVYTPEPDMEARR